MTQVIFEETDDLYYDPPLCAVCGHEDDPSTPSTHSKVLGDDDLELCPACFLRVEAKANAIEGELITVQTDQPLRIKLLSPKSVIAGDSITVLVELL